MSGFNSASGFSGSSGSPLRVSACKLVAFGKWLPSGDGRYVSWAFSCADDLDDLIVECSPSDGTREGLIAALDSTPSVTGNGVLTAVCFAFLSPLAHRLAYQRALVLLATGGVVIASGRLAHDVLHITCTSKRELARTALRTEPCALLSIDWLWIVGGENHQSAGSKQ